jgi:hypothetical protein
LPGVVSFGTTTTDEDPSGPITIDVSTGCPAESVDDVAFDFESLHAASANTTNIAVANRCLLT